MDTTKVAQMCAICGEREGIIADPWEFSGGGHMMFCRTCHVDNLTADYDLEMTRQFGPQWRTR